MRIALLVALGAALVLPLGAQTYWSDGFDTYGTGQLAPGTGGWYGWDNVATVIGDVVAGPALSAPNALRIDNLDDTIQPFVLNDPTNYPRSCQWRLTGWWYIDGATFLPGSGDQFILIQNTYNHLGPYTWALQLHASPASMTIVDDNRVEAVVPVITDQWVEVRVDIDLDNDTLTTYYGGVQVSTGAYVVGGGPLEIACLDLFVDAAGSVSYWDDLSLVQISPDEFQRNRLNASLDFDGVQALRCAPAVTTRPTNTMATVNVASPLTTSPWDMLVTLGPVAPLSGNGFPVGTQIVNVDLALPFFFLNTGTTTGSLLPFPGSFSVPINTGPNPVTLAAQMVIIDPSAAEGISLSQAAQLDVVAVPCITVEAVGTNNFNSVTTSGFWRVIHRGNCADIVSVTFDVFGVATQTTMVFDTDQTGMADRFDGGNSTVAGCLGTYRNGSDVATGLVYAGTPAAPCDPAANTGWIGANPTTATSFKTLTFTFAGGLFTNQTFEFDVDTDGGLGTTGGAMRDIVITVTLSDLTVVTGPLVLDPADPNRSSVDFL